MSADTEVATRILLCCCSPRSHANWSHVSVSVLDIGRVTCSVYAAYSHGSIMDMKKKVFDKGIGICNLGLYKCARVRLAVKYPAELR